jgi:hypothetical protein
LAGDDFCQIGLIVLVMAKSLSLRKMRREGDFEREVEVRAGDAKKRKKGVCAASTSDRRFGST